MMYLRRQNLAVYVTLPKTNMKPENWLLADSGFGNYHFQVLLLGVSKTACEKKLTQKSATNSFS